MNKINICLFISVQILTVTPLFSTPSIQKPTKNHITLESQLLHTFDGTSVGINGNVVRLIMYVRREINTQLFGARTTDTSSIGTYTFENKQYSIQELIELEDIVNTSGTSAQRASLAQLLQRAKNEFIEKVRPFMENARNSKRIMLILIEESCMKRNLEDRTLLIRWAESKTEQDEITIFNQEITSFKLFNKFCCDLLNFLGDLIISCPKGVAQFKQSYDKQDKILHIIPQLVGIQNIAPEKRNKFQHDFIHYLFEHHIHKMTLTDISPAKLEILLQEFQNKH